MSTFGTMDFSIKICDTLGLIGYLSRIQFKDIWRLHEISYFNHFFVCIWVYLKNFYHWVCSAHVSICIS